MTGDGGTPASAVEHAASTQWSAFWRRFVRHRMAVISVFLLALLLVGCFGADWLAPYDQNEQNLVLGPVGPSLRHWFGTDELGRDQLTEIMFAGRVSLKIGLAVAFIATVAGTVLGALAGFFGRLPDQLLMRLTDLFLVVPAIAILAIAIKKFGSDALTIVLVLAGLGWMYIARIVRGQVLSLREKEFVEASKSLGASNRRIIFREILPNLVAPIIVYSSVLIPQVILYESALSFLGVGVQPPRASWGQMIAEATDIFNTAWWYMFFPGMALLLTVLAFNLVGDALQDALHPRARRSA